MSPAVRACGGASSLWMQRPLGVKYLAVVSLSAAPSQRKTLHGPLPEGLSPTSTRSGPEWRPPRSRRRSRCPSRALPADIRRGPSWTRVVARFLNRHAAVGGHDELSLGTIARETSIASVRSPPGSVSGPLPDPDPPLSNFVGAVGSPPRSRRTGQAHVPMLSGWRTRRHALHFDDLAGQHKLQVVRL
jgi:hypothetical protein